MVTADYLYALDSEIIFYFCVITVPISLLTKVVAVYIYTRPNLNKKTNTGLLYLIFSLLNALTLLMVVFIVRSNIIFGYQFNFVCGLADFIRTDIFNFSIWIQAVISLDRYILISYPTKVGIMLKKKVIFSIILGTAVFICILNVPYFISQRLTTVSFINSTNGTNQTQVTVSCITSSYVTLINNIIALLMRIYIPFILMIVFNLISIRDLKKSRKRVDKHKSHSSLVGNKNEQRKMPSIIYKFTVSNLAMDFIFLFFYLPLTVSYTLNIVSYFVPIFGTDDVATADFTMFLDMSQLFAFFYHMIDIFIFLAFNRLFRDDLLLLLGLRCFVKRHVYAV